LSAEEGRGDSKYPIVSEVFMMKKKVLFPATTLILLTILPAAFAGIPSSSTNDALQDLTLANDSIGPSAQQSQFDFLDISYASIDCDSSTCTFLLKVVGTIATATSLPPQIKQMQYWWRMWDSGGSVIFNVIVYWSKISGWEVSRTGGPVQSWAGSGDTLTVVVDASVVPSSVYRWQGRAAADTSAATGYRPSPAACYEYTLPTQAMACPWFLSDRTPNVYPYGL
jgi:hypothetical protein